VALGSGEIRQGCREPAGGEQMVGGFICSPRRHPYPACEPSNRDRSGEENGPARNRMIGGAEGSWSVDRTV